MRILLLAATAALSFAVPAAANTTYDFSLTGDFTATWSMPASPTPTFAFDGALAVFTGITFTLPGNVTATYDFLIFPSVNSGGISISDPNDKKKNPFSGGGDEIFTGSLAAPTFKTGTFALFDGGNVQTGSLSISAPLISQPPVSGAVPEPASWAMLIAGFGLTGAAMRRRRVSVAAG